MIHTTPNHDDYEPKANNQPNDNKNNCILNWTDDTGETIEMLEMTKTRQTVINNFNERETNGHHVNNYTGPFTKTTSTELIEAYDKL